MVTSERSRESIVSTLYHKNDNCILHLIYFLFGHRKSSRQQISVLPLNWTGSRFSAAWNVARLTLSVEAMIVCKIFICYMYMDTIRSHRAVSDMDNHHHIPPASIYSTYHGWWWMFGIHSLLHLTYVYMFHTTNPERHICTVICVECMVYIMHARDCWRSPTRRGTEIWRKKNTHTLRDKWTRASSRPFSLVVAVEPCRSCKNIRWPTTFAPAVASAREDYGALHHHVTPHVSPNSQQVFVC